MTQNNIIWHHKVFYLLDLIQPLIFSPKMPFSPYFRLLTNVKWQLPSGDDDVGDDDDDDDGDDDDVFVFSSGRLLTNGKWQLPRGAGQEKLLWTALKLLETYFLAKNGTETFTGRGNWKAISFWRTSKVSLHWTKFTRCGSQQYEDYKKTKKKLYLGGKRDPDSDMTLMRFIFSDDWTASSDLIVANKSGAQALKQKW